MIYVPKPKPPCVLCALGVIDVGAAVSLALFIASVIVLCAVMAS
jgi:hypothetical protein